MNMIRKFYDLLDDIGVGGNTTSTDVANELMVKFKNILPRMDYKTLENTAISCVLIVCDTCIAYLKNQIQSSSLAACKNNYQIKFLEQVKNVVGVPEEPTPFG